MSTTVPSPNGDAPSATPSLILPDEDALRRVFTTEFATLAGQAQSRLGEAASLTPRVVETAFVRAWQEREKIQTSEELHAFLAEEVQHGAARALRKRAAAHRLGHHGEEEGHASTTTHVEGAHANLEVSWAHVLKTIHPQHDAEAMKAAAAISRHEAAEHITEMAKGKSLLIPITIGIVAIGLAVGGVALADRLGAARATEQAVNSQDARNVATAFGQLGELNLDDGTKVRLAPETKLSIPKKFSVEKLRAVKVGGSATFEVKQGLPNPLQVFAGNAVVIAKGTSFTIGAYPNSNTVTVQVKEGAVDVRVGEVVRAANAGEALLVDKSGAIRPPTADELEEAIGWTNGRLTLVNRQLRDVLPQLQRWYNLDVKVPELPVLERTLTLRVPLDSTRMAIAQVEQGAGVKYKNVNNVKVFLDDKAAKKK
jgi:ferric-dicitrate binding protein FerR (iron transport regulator)